MECVVKDPANSTSTHTAIRSLETSVKMVGMELVYVREKRRVMCGKHIRMEPIFCMFYLHTNKQSNC
jgi:hypothetical protein